MSVLVVGGTKGIGRATALRFAETGEFIFVNGHADTEAAEKTAAMVRDRGAEAVVILGDVSTADGAQAILDEVSAHTSHLRVVVHCAVSPVSGLLLELDPKQVERSVQTGGLSVLYLVKAAESLLSEGSSITFVSSLGALRAVPRYGAIGVAKATAEALVRYLAVELAPRGIRVNTVSSGPVDTDAYRAAFPDADERLAQAAERSPAHRPQTVDDVAKLIHLVASPGMALVQGQHIRVDGGLYL